MLPILETYNMVTEALSHIEGVEICITRAGVEVSHRPEHDAEVHEILQRLAADHH